MRLSRYSIVVLPVFGILLYLWIALPISTLASSESHSPQVATPASTVPLASQITSEKKITGYTLPPDLYRKAKALSSIRFRLDLIDFVYGLFILLFILRTKLGVLFRDWAEKISPNRFLQSLVFSPLLIISTSILQLPVDLYSHTVSREYGLSVESWGSMGLGLGEGDFRHLCDRSSSRLDFVRRDSQSPRRWWFYFWLISIPIMLFLTFAEPFVIEPMFFQFAPLEQKDPQLVAQIERVVQRGGLRIPPDRMFWMKASDKTPTMNAYVSGLALPSASWCGTPPLPKKPRRKSSRWSDTRWAITFWATCGRD